MSPSGRSSGSSKDPDANILYAVGISISATIGVLAIGLNQFGVLRVLFGAADAIHFTPDIIALTTAAALIGVAILVASYAYKEYSKGSDNLRQIHKKENAALRSPGKFSALSRTPDPDAKTMHEHTHGGKSPIASCKN